MKNCFVYQHIRITDGKIFYIGIGKSYTYKKYSRAYSRQFRNNLWHKIVNKHGFKWQILFENLTSGQAKEKEKELIKFYGRIDLQTGILSNMTDGGDGINNYKFTDEVKAKIKKSRIGKKPMLGKSHSISTRKKMSETRSKNMRILYPK